MSNEFAQRYSVRELVRRVGGEQAFSWPIVAITFPFSIFTTLGYDHSRFGGSILLWIVVGIASHCVGVLAALPWAFGLWPDTARTSKPLLTIVAFVIVGMTRGLFTGWFEEYLGLSRGLEIAYRIFGGSMTGLVLLGSASTGLSIWRERTQARRELLEQRAQLQFLREGAEDLIQSKHQELSTLVTSQVEPHLKDIAAALTQLGSHDVEQVQALAQEIIRINNERIRPLSMALYKSSAIDAQLPRPPASVDASLNFRLPVNLNGLINPLPTTQFITLLAAPAYFLTVGIKALPVGLAMAFLLFCFFTIAQRLISSRFTMQLRFAIPAVMGISTLAFSPVILVAQVFHLEKNAVHSLKTAGTLGVLLVSGGIAFLMALDHQTLDYDERFHMTNELASHELSIFQKNLWHLQQRTARKLHGKVQATLTSTSMRLERIGSLSQSEIAQLRDDIRHLATVIAESEETPTNLMQDCAELADMWEGMCDIEVAVAPETLTRLDHDATSAFCISEIVKEAVSNAIKHGRATKINIEVAQEVISSGVPVIEVCVTNNGEYRERQTTGLGSLILDETTLSWRLVAVPEGSQLVAVVALDWASSTIET